jgi:hypothetical protein
MYWGMASITNIGVLALALLSLYSLIYYRYKAVSILLATIAVYTSANGIFVFVAGLFVLLYKREWINTTFWVVVGLIDGFTYWYSFESDVTSEKLVNKSFQLLPFLQSSVSLVGGAFYTQKAPLLSLILGIMILLGIIIKVYKWLIIDSSTEKTGQLFVLSCVLFFLLTIAAISYGRYSTTILSVSRYKIYSVMFLVFLYMIYIDWIIDKIVLFRMVLVCAGCFWLFSYVRYWDMFKRHEKTLTAHYFNWKYSHRLDLPSSDMEIYYALHLNNLYQSQHYVPGKGTEEEAKELMKKVDCVSLKFPQINENNIAIISSNFINIQPLTLPNGNYFLTVKSKGKVAIYPLNTLKSNPFLQFQLMSEYTTTINKLYWIGGTSSTLSVIRE